MSTKRVIIDIAPSKLVVAVVSAGKVVDSRTRLWNRSEWPTLQPGQQASDAIAELAEPLREFVDQLKIRGHNVTLIYSAQGSTAGVTACPTAAGLASAEQAARLALASVADFPIEYSLNDTACLLTESAAKHAATSTTPQFHILAGGDAEHRTLPLCNLLSSCSLRVQQMISAEALALAEAVALATSSSGTSQASDQVRAVLWLGDHCSALAAGMPGRLLFVRGVGIGYESLVDAACRPLRGRDPSQPGVTLERADATALIKSVGIPEPDMPLPGVPGLAGAALLPHLQPVLQRLSIETKQSLRFGVPESSRGKIGFSVAGPGAVIPNVMLALSRLAGVPVAAELLPNAVVSTIEAMIRQSSIKLNMAPAALVQANTARHMRRALLAGAVLAAALIGFEYASAYLSLRSERHKLSHMTQQSQQREGSERSVKRLLDVQKASTALALRVDQSMGEQPNIAAVFNSLGHASTEFLRLSSIELSRDKSLSRLTVRGGVRYADASDPPALINRFMNELSALPIIESSKLVSTQRSLFGGHDSQSFEISFELLRLPSNSSASLKTEQASAQVESSASVHVGANTP